MPFKDTFGDALDVSRSGGSVRISIQLGEFWQDQDGKYHTPDGEVELLFKDEDAIAIATAILQGARGR